VSVRDIARRLHIPSHSVVSKRLKLLTLPTALQEAIADHRLGVTDAETLGQLESGELQVQAWELMNQRKLPVARAIDEVQRRPHRRDPGEGPQKRRSDDRPVSNEVTDPDDSASEEAERSTQARFAAGQELACRRGDSDDVARLVAGYVLQGNSSSSHRDAVRLAHRWLHRAGVGPATISDPLTYLAAVGPAEVVHVAFMVAVAADELHIRSGRPWERRDAAHVRRLATVGYVPSDREQRLLERWG